MTSQKVVTLPSSAPEIKDMARRMANNQPLPEANRMPFQHLEELWLLSVVQDLDVNVLDYAGDGTPYDASNPKHRTRHMDRRVMAYHRGEWTFIGIIVTLARHPDRSNSLWGIESDSGAEWFAQTIHDLCAQILHELKPSAIDETTAPLAEDVKSTEDVKPAIARRYEARAISLAKDAEELVKHAEQIWHAANDKRADTAARQIAFDQIAEQSTRAAAMLQEAQGLVAAADGIYAEGVDRPTPPFLVSGCALQVERITGRIRWMATDLSTPHPAIAGYAPTRVIQVLKAAGYDHRRADHALSFLTSQWDGDYQLLLGISWRDLDKTAIWIKQQQEVVSLGASVGIDVINHPLPSKDAIR